MSKLITKVSISVVSIATVLSLSGAASLIPSSVHGATVEELQAQIAALMAQITAMQSQLSTSGSSASSSAVPASLLSSSDLTVGSKGAAVMDLQKFLNASGYAVATSGAGSAGNETTYFGNATKAALAKFQAAQGISPAAGYFGAKTRAKLSAMGSASTGSTGTSTGSTGTVVTPSGSGLSVSVASSNPVSGNFPAGATQVPFLNLNMSAGASDVTVTAMNVYRGGLSSDNDIQNVYLMDGSKVLATNLGLANGKASFSLPAGIFTVKAGTSKVITVAADVLSSVTTSHTYSWNVNAASDITASATVSGNFPMLSNVMTAVSVTNPALATLALNDIVTGGQVNAGSTNFLAGEFSMQANNSAVSVKSVKLTETGTINASTDLANIKLMNGSVQVGATALSLNADGTVVFDLSSNPLQIPSGQTVNLMVYADVVGGVNRNFTLTIQRSYDVVSTDMSYNVGASSTGTFPINGSQVSVSQGTLTVSKDANSPANYVVPGSTNQTLASFDFAAAGEAVRITALSYKISYSSQAENTVWNNLKLVDDQGVQIGTLASSGSISDAAKQTDLTNLNYIIPAGQTRVLSIKADVISGYTGTIEGDLVSGSGQGYTSLASVTVPAQSGNSLSASSASFSATVNNAVGNIITVSGAQSVKIGSFSLSAGAAEGANVISVTLKTAASNVANHFQNLKVLNGSTQIGYTQTTLANDQPYTFSVSSPIAIAAGGSAIVDVYADTISGATSSAATVVSLTGASATGMSSNSSKTLSGTPAGQTVAVNAAGTLSAALSPDSPVSQQVAMGLSGLKLASFKLSADNNEGLSVTSVSVIATSTVAADLANIKLMNGTTQVGSTISGLAGTSTALTFTIPSGALVVPQNGNVTLSMVADINGINNAVSGDTVDAGFLSAMYSGAASNAANTLTSHVDSGATFTIYKGVLSVATSGTTVGTTDSIGTLIGKVVFSNSSPSALQDLTLASTTILLNVYNATSTATSTTLTVYDNDNGKTLGTTTVTFGVSKAIDLLTNVPVITAGSSKNISFYMTPLTSAQKVTSTNTISGNVSMPEYSWSDGVSKGIAHNPAITTMPAWSNITLVP